MVGPKRWSGREALFVSQAVIARSKTGATAFSILGAISFCHLLNDMMQALLPAIYPILKGGFDLSFGQIGLLTLTYQITASLLQPLIGLYTDRRPQPYSLPFGMGSTLLGLVALAFAPNYPTLVAGSALLGVGSPRAARMAWPSRCSRSAAISANRSGR